MFGVRRRGRSVAPDALDLVAVVAEQNRGWVLETISRHLTDRVVGASALHYLPERPDAPLPPLPPARAYFFSHYLLYLRVKDDPNCRAARSLVFFTHPGFAPGDARAVARGLRSCTTVVSMSSTQAPALANAGFPARKMAIVLPGADPDRFRGHARGSGAVGLVSGYYPRKSPDRIAEIVEALPNREFRLLGPNWREAPIYERLVRLPNFRHLELEYADYPSFYDGIDVFVSPSALEGGPIPLLEAMMANAVPVATRTGFAPDIIRDGENGFLCDVDAPPETFARLIEQAYALRADVRATVEHLTWEAFAASVLALAFPDDDA
ncbi:MAG: glycosyltransferase family 4 protein [Acidimicrobiia bacterium]|jgi:glycosyltransferase involved in cell wall biosynthesis